jgi:hypothetical protein
MKIELLQPSQSKTRYGQLKPNLRRKYSDRIKFLYIRKPQNSSVKLECENRSLKLVFKKNVRNKT